MQRQIISKMTMTLLHGPQIQINLKNRLPPHKEHNHLNETSQCSLLIDRRIQHQKQNVWAECKMP